MAQVVEGLRSQQIPQGARAPKKPAPREEMKPSAQDTPRSAKLRTFGSINRGFWIQLARFKAKQIGDEVIPARTVQIHLTDGVIRLNPDDPEDAEKIELIEKHEFFGTPQLYDRDKALKEQAQSEAVALAELIKAAAADPLRRETLKAIAGDSLLEMLKPESSED